MKKILSFFLIAILGFILLSCNLTPTEVDLEETFNKLFVNVDMDNVTEDLTFKTKIKGVSIAYESENQDVISNLGVVNRQGEDTTVNVIITLTYNEDELVKKVTFKVLGTGEIVEPTTYNVTLDYDATLGSVSSSANDLTKIVENTKVTFTVEPNAGYKLDKVLVNGVETLVNENSFVVTVNKDTTVSVAFVEDTSSQEEVTVSITIDTYAQNNNWVEKSKYDTVVLNNDVTATMTTGSNSGSYYAPNTYSNWPSTWRMYATESSTLTISTTEGKYLSTVKISFVTKDDGILGNSTGTVTYNSDEVITVNALSVTFSVVNLSGTKGKVFITGIEATYVGGEAPDTPVNPDPVDPEIGDLTALEAALEKFENDYTQYNFVIEETLYIDNELYSIASVTFDDDKAYFTIAWADYHDESEELYLTFDEQGNITSVVALGENGYVLYQTETNIDTILSQSYNNLLYYEFLTDVNNFYQVNETTFAALPSVLNTAAKSFLTDWDYDTSKEVFSSFVVTVENNQVVEAVLKSTYTSSQGSENDEYHITMTGVGTQSIVIPDATLYEGGEDETYDPISSIYSLSSGDSFMGIGYVTGILNNKVFVADETDSILLYYSNANYVPSGLKVGDTLEFMGNLDIYNGLYEIKITSADDSVISSQVVTKVDNKTYSDLSQIKDSNMADVINVQNVTLSTYTAQTNKNTTATITDIHGNSLTFYIERNAVNYFNAAFTDVDTTSPVNINNLYVGYYNGLQISVTSSISVSSAYGLVLENDHITLDSDASVDDLFNAIDVKWVDQNGVLTLNKEDYSLTTDLVDFNNKGIYELTLTYNNESVSLYVTIIVKEVRTSVAYDKLETVANNTTKSEEYPDGFKPGLPSTGDVEVLVIPVKFTNSPNYDLSLLEIAFNGTNEATGWYSLNGYYKAASFGNLNITANILAPYETNESYSLSKGNTGTEDYKYLHDAINYYDNQIDYTKYDQNGDGYIDLVYLVYLAPYDGNTDLWWAYCYEYFEEGEEEKFDGLSLDWYMWFSYEFFQEPIYDTTGTSNDITITANCETVIHETGHALGLDDYYDYNQDNGDTGGVGGFAMMDYNIGDHDPFSKAILGWINPDVVVYHDYEKVIGSQEATGDAIIISKTGEESYFTEYYIISYYTPTGVNALKAPYGVGLPSNSGIVIYHIDATLLTQEEIAQIEDGIGVIDIYRYNNASTEHKLISINEADGNNSIEKGSLCSDSDLYKAGSVINNLKWYDGTSVGCTITVGEFTTNGVNIQINF